MGAFDDLIPQQAGAAANPFADLIAPRASDALTLPPGLRRNEPYTGPTIGQAVGGAISGMGQDLAARLQATSPVVQPLAGKSDYGPPLGEAGPLDSGGTGWIDATGMHKADPAKHVILNDPQTNRPMVYQRSGATGQPEKGGIGGWLDVANSLGGLLGLGTTASSNIGLRAPARGAIDIIQDRLGGAERQAQRIVGGALRSDVAGGGPAPWQISDVMANSPTPVLPVDVAGENVRGVAGQAFRTPGPGRTTMRQTLEERDALAGRTLSTATDTMATGQPAKSTFAAARELEQQAKTQAGPLYRNAEMQPPLNPDHLQPGGELNVLLQRKSMSAAARNALEIAQEGGVNPASLGITFNAAGDPVLAATPSWRTLHYMKRGMDDVLETYRNKITGKLDLDDKGREVLNTQQQYLRLIDRENPLYAQARAAWAGPKQSEAALKRGEHAFTKGVDEIAADLSDLSAAEQQFYRLGAANKLKLELAQASSGGDEARRLLGNANRQDQIRALFPQANEAGNLLDVARGEKLKFGTMREVMGGSQTAGRVAEDAGTAPGLVGTLVEGAIAQGTGGVAGRGIVDGLRAWMSGRSKMSPQTAELIVGQLLQSDPALSRAWMMQAFDRGRSAAGKPVF